MGSARAFRSWLASWLASGHAMLAWLAGIAVVTACGPSFQVLYEGDARFEHCYALDESSTNTMQQKSDCWREWTLHYTYGQTRDRVEYAAARYRALSRAPQAPTDEAVMEAAPGEGRGSSIAAPAPTSAFAPPPKTLPEADGGAPVLTASSDVSASIASPARARAPAAASSASPDAGAPPVLPSPPPRSHAACIDECTSAAGNCRESCIGAKACDGCGATQKKCVKGCPAK